MKTCFSIMPFGDAFLNIDSILEESAHECGLTYVRGDRTETPGSVMPQILHEIKRAAVIVADITDHNPNVFYELGIAHQLVGPERVVIITQTIDGKVAYDIHQFRQLTYTTSSAGLARMRQELPKRLAKAMESGTHREYWDVVRGGLPRTRLIVRDLQRLVAKAEAESRSLTGTKIRVAAGLSSLAISDEEMAIPELGGEYGEALMAERDALRAALMCGAEMIAVLNPPRRFAERTPHERLIARYKKLIAMLEGGGELPSAAEDAIVIKQCQFALSPVPMPNVLIIGQQIAYEGMKRGNQGGFAVTHCETSPEGLGDLTAQYDLFFDESLREMVRSHPPDGRLVEQLRGFYDEAVAAKLRRGA